jgi:1-acyl-sn-glycerol-3-phosphate acyltransferase
VSAIDTSCQDEGCSYDVFGPNPPILERLLEACAPIYDRYFRIASEGIEHIPTHGPAILVANHGGELPIDAAMLCFDVFRRLEPPRLLRAVAHHFASRPSLVSVLCERYGVVSGMRANLAQLLDRGELVAIWPEGVTGPATRFRDRYRIEAWRVGFAELALRHRAPIVPVAIVGVEESWPLVMKLGVRWFDVPCLPSRAWSLPLPAPYRIHYGAPIHLARDHTGGDAADPAIVEAAAERVRGVLERQIQDLRMVRRVCR